MTRQGDKATRRRGPSIRRLAILGGYSGQATRRQDPRTRPGFLLSTLDSQLSSRRRRPLRGSRFFRCSSPVSAFGSRVSLIGRKSLSPRSARREIRSARITDPRRYAFVRFFVLFVTRFRVCERPRACGICGSVVDSQAAGSAPRKRRPRVSPIPLSRVYCLRLQCSVLGKGRSFWEIKNLTGL